MHRRWLWLLTVFAVTVSAGVIDFKRPALPIERTPFAKTPFPLR